MTALYAGTLFLSAFLLFLLQPVVGKTLLPALGGSPAVWNTCLVFFQSALLLGYLYAHETGRRLGERRQVGLHLALLLAPALVMVVLTLLAGSPLAVPRDWVPQGQTNPVAGVLLLLTLTAGVPFVVVSATAPLLQRWYAAAGGPGAKDPYFLYAASNAGSLLALLAYPFAVEPAATLSAQGWLWAAGYAVLAGLVAVCGVGVWRTPVGPGRLATADDSPERRTEELAGLRDGRDTVPAPVPTWRQRSHWLALAFVPSSLLLGVTTLLTTDVPPQPLLWVLPLALYLLTFIVAFGRVPGWVHTAAALAAPVLLLLAVFLVTSGARPVLAVALAVHLGAFAALALALHGELARARPRAERLTEFYLWVALGGALGGVFNALVAPLVFSSVWEYHVGLAAAACLIPALSVKPTGPGRRWADLVLPLGVGVLAVVLMDLWNRGDDNTEGIARAYRRLLMGLQHGVNAVLGRRPADGSGFKLASVALVVTFGVPAMLCYAMVDRPRRFGLAVALVLLAAALGEDRRGLLRQERSYFGVLRVTDGRGLRQLLHGTTLHGAQRLPATAATAAATVAAAESAFGAVLQSLALAEVVAELAEPADETPLTYYHRRGPLGQLFAEFAGPRAKREVAVVGLGTGTAAAYAGPGQRFTFYEIDPLVKKLADAEGYFTFLSGARQRGAECEIILGDARLQLGRAEGKRYGLMIIDAFNSDAVPVHLLTVEALRLYLDRLETDGVLAFHISNQYLDLEPVIAAAARLPEFDLTAYAWQDGDDKFYGKSDSTWVVLARKPEDLGGLPLRRPSHLPPSEVCWRPAEVDPNIRPWTDHYSSLFAVRRREDGGR